MKISTINIIFFIEFIKFNFFISDYVKMLNSLMFPIKRKKTIGLWAGSLKKKKK